MATVRRRKVTSNEGASNADKRGSGSDPLSTASQGFQLECVDFSSACDSLHLAGLSVTGMSGRLLAPGAAVSGTFTWMRIVSWSLQYSAVASAFLMCPQAFKSTWMSRVPFCLLNVAGGQCTVSTPSASVAAAVRETIRCQNILHEKDLVFHCHATHRLSEYPLQWLHQTT